MAKPPLAFSTAVKTDKAARCTPSSAVAGKIVPSSIRLKIRSTAFTYAPRSVKAASSSVLFPSGSFRPSINAFVDAISLTASGGRFRMLKKDFEMACISAVTEFSKTPLAVTGNSGISTSDVPHFGWFNASLLGASCS